jgi:predicted amidohydrolase
MLRKNRFYFLLIPILIWFFFISLFKIQALAVDKIPLKVATVCMNAKNNKQDNLQTFFYFMREASENGAHLIVFPEIALQQNPAWGRYNYKPTQTELNYVRNSAETIPGSSTKKLVDKAKELNIYVVFGMTEKSAKNDALYNSSVFLGPNGIVGKYRKINLWDSAGGGNEHLSWEPGAELGIFDSPIGKIGLIICFDMSKLLGMALANEGADLLVTVSAWPSYEGKYYESFSKQNALIANRWHIVSNQVGSVGHTMDYGHSRIIDPKGTVIADTGKQEGIAIVETDIMIEANILGIDDSDDFPTTWGMMKLIP